MHPEKENSIRFIAFQHTPSEPLGNFEHIFSENDIPFEYTLLWENDSINFGDASSPDIPWGPMSVSDEEEFPWLKEEKKLIRLAVRKRIPMLGLCLGIQLIASAHGSPVYQFIKETRWYPVHPASDSAGIFASFPDTFHVFLNA